MSPIDHNSGCTLLEFSNEHRREIHIALQAHADIRKSLLCKSRNRYQNLIKKIVISPIKIVFLHHNTIVIIR